MPTTVTSPYVEAAEALAAILDAEFTDLNIVTQHDNLHESLGYMGTVVGVAPEYERPQGTDAVVNEIYLKVKFYGMFIKDVDNQQTVDPRVAAIWAERFRRAVQAYNETAPGSTTLWYMAVTSVDYPKDPTGNKSRFEATVRAYGQNTALTETIG